VTCCCVAGGRSPAQALPSLRTCTGSRLLLTLAAAAATATSAAAAAAAVAAAAAAEPALCWKQWQQQHKQQQAFWPALAATCYVRCAECGALPYAAVQRNRSHLVTAQSRLCSACFAASTAWVVGGTAALCSADVPDKACELATTVCTLSACSVHRPCWGSCRILRMT
jgi:hypothetical protein